MELNYSTKLVCAECGSDQIQVLAWIDANTNEYKSEGTDDRENHWCEKCQEHVEFITEDQLEYKDDIERDVN